MQIKNNLPLLLVLFVASCNGQNQRSQRIGDTGSVTLMAGDAKIVRTQGTQSGVVDAELLDKDGNLWFSIGGEGAYRYDGRSFANFTTKDGLCSNTVGAIIQDKSGNILFGTNRGICRYDGKAFTTYPVPDTLSITCMLEDRNSSLWFATTAHGIYRYNGKSLDNFLYSNDHTFNLGNNNQFILDMLQDNNGNIWFSSWNGGGVWKYDGKNFVNFLPPAGYYTSNQDRRSANKPINTFNSNTSNNYSPSQDHITDDMIFSMTEDNAGNIWFATRDHGICRYDGNIFKSYGGKEGFLSRGATAILEDRKGIFWFATVDSGIWRYDGKVFKNFTEKDGLVNNAVMSILEDKDGNLWFGTKYLGLSRYDGKIFTTFSRYDN